MTPSESSIQKIVDHLAGHGGTLDEETSRALEEETSMETNFVRQQALAAELCLSDSVNWFEDVGAADNPHVSAFLDVRDELKQEVQAHARRQLTEMLGDVSERFNAFNASLFLFSPPNGSRLTAVISRNVKNLETWVEERPGIVPHVAREGRGYYSNDVANDKNYRLDVEDTESEIAVPLITYDNQVIGVLNLESRDKNAYNAADVEELQALAGAFISHLIVACLTGDNRDSKLSPIWHPELYGYDLTSVFNRICHALSQSIHGDYSNCSLWHADKAKELLFVCSTTGYDVEYKCHRTLPAKSFLGSIVDLDSNHVEAIDPLEDDRFLRKDKADRVNMRRVLAAPIKSPNFQTDSGVGVLAVYLADEQLETRELHDALRYIAKELGNILAVCERRRKDFVLSHLYHLLYQKPRSSESDFEVMRDVLANVFSGDGVSIFARQSDGDNLYCVATTGLNRRASSGDLTAAVAADERQAIYHLKEDSGYTVFLARDWCQCLRINCFLDSSERGLPEGRPAPQLKYSENFAPQHDHRRRRMLGKRVSYWRDVGGELVEDTLGVIRILRCPDSELFTVSDEQLLSTITSFCRKHFLDWRRTTQELRPKIDSVDGVDDEQDQATIIARRAYTIPLMRSSRTLIDESLRDLYSCFKGKYEIRQTRLMVRHIVAGEAFASFLTHAYYAEPDRQLPLPDQPVSLVERPFSNIAESAKTIKEGIHAISGWAESIGKSGIWMPIRAWLGDAFIEAILAVEADSDINWLPQDLLEVFDTSARLAAIWGVTDPRGTSNNVIDPEVCSWDWPTVIELCRKHVDVSLAVDSSIVWVSDPDYAGILKWPTYDADDEIAKFGVRQHQTGQIAIPLSIGSVAIGVLTCDCNFDQKQLHSFLGEVFGLWANLCLGRWTSKEFGFTSKLIDQSGIREWFGRFCVDPNSTKWTPAAPGQSLFTIDLSDQAPQVVSYDTASSS